MYQEALLSAAPGTAGLWTTALLSCSDRMAPQAVGHAGWQAGACQMQDE